MGAGNVKAAYAHWSSLPGKPFQLLAFMALTAGDKDDPPVSWMKRERLAAGLGRRVADEDLDDPAVTAERKAAFKSLGEHIAVLTRHGAITRTRKPQTGVTAEYRLNLTDELIDDARSRLDRTPKTGDQSDRENGSQSPASETGNCGPADTVSRSTAPRKAGQQDHENRGPEEEKQDLHQDLAEDTSARSATTVTDAPDRCPKCDGRVTVRGGRHCVAGCGWSEAGT